MRTAQRSQPAGRLVEGLPGPDRRHGHRQPAAARLGEVRRRGGDHAHAEPRREFGQCGVALVVEGMAVMGQLDTDPVGAEAVHQVGQRLGGGTRPAGRQRLAHMPFTAAGQNVPVPAGGLGQGVVVIARAALLPTGQMRGGQLTGQPPVAFRSAGQNEQMRARRIGHSGAGGAAQRQLGAEDGAHAEVGGRLGEAHHPVEPVVVGQRDGPQIQPGRLLDEFLRASGAVEEAERRMGVQLGIGHGRRAAGRARRRGDGGTFAREPSLFELPRRRSGAGVASACPKGQPFSSARRASTRSRKPAGTDSWRRGSSIGRTRSSAAISHGGSGTWSSS